MANMFSFCNIWTFILAGIPFALYVYLRWNLNFWKRRGLPTAKPLTLLGSLPSVLTRKRNMIYDMDDIYRKYRHKYRVIGIFVTRQPAILILDPKLGQEILATNFSSYSNTLISTFVVDRKADSIVNRNPFWAQGEQWKASRADALGGLTHNRLKQALSIWHVGCEKMSQFLAAQTAASGAALIDSRDLANRFVGAVLSDFIWGIDTSSFDARQDSKNASAFIEFTHKWLDHATHAHNYGYITLVAPILRQIWRYRFFLQSTDDFFRKLTSDAVEMRCKSSKNLRERADFLNHLLDRKEKNALTNDDLTSYALLVLLDGYETMGYALLHALYYIAKDEAVQQKLRCEILSFTAQNVNQDNPIAYDNLTSLPYLEQCINETLRINTLIPHLSRVCTKSTQLKISEDSSIDIPKGTIVKVPTYSFTHDETYFPQPHVFDPERFANGKADELTKKGIFLPFGDGPRICMGNRVVMMSLKLALIEIVSKYELCIDAPVDENPNMKMFVQGLAGDILIKFQRLH